MADRVEKLASIAMTASAMVIAATLLFRQFDRETPISRRPREPEYVEDWRRLLPVGRLLGQASAPVEIVAFVDLECPFCARFHANVASLRRRFGENLSLSYLHYPLANHRFAMPAARAAECSADQGRFYEFVDRVYESQDSLGLKTWVEYAQNAAVGDTARFRRCAADTAPVAKIQQGLALGSSLGINGTPTVLINGWRYPLPPSDSVIVTLLQSLQAGRDPFSSYRK